MGKSMESNNFLLGYGEKLASSEKKPGAQIDKKPPYSIPYAKDRVEKRIHIVNEDFRNVPDLACPNGELVAVLTLHHRYIAKSEYPNNLLRHVGLRPIGRKPSKKFLPENWGTTREPKEPLESEDLFVAGTREAFLDWELEIQNWPENRKYAIELPQIEEVFAFNENLKVKSTDELKTDSVYEFGLHNDFEGAKILNQFYAYALYLGAQVRVEKARQIGGLTFVPVVANSKAVFELAKFTFVRVARVMPRMRPLAPSFTRSGSNMFEIKLPERNSISSNTRVVIFDGGLPPESLEYLSPWVNYYEPIGIGPSDPDGLSHGLAVTSSFLFGSIDPSNDELSTPFCNVDHVRVLEVPQDENYEDYYDVLSHIEHHLVSNPGKYEFVNLSLGPEMPIDDDEVNPWTAMLDQLFAGKDMLATVAAGNWGHRDASLGYNRVQPPADGVNVMSIGATDSLGNTGQRAPYSCVGPGRSPGLVKPDGVTFGGSVKAPFRVLVPNPTPAIGFEAGTSFASPFALRSAASIRAHLGGKLDTGPSLSPLAIRALLVHKSHDIGLDRSEGGWGIVPHDYRHLITTADDEVMVVYQGDLIAGKFLRLHAPIKNVPLSGEVEITATLLISPQVDPESASTYTRSGLDVIFRPDIEDYSFSKGKRSHHPKSKPFFSPKMGGTPEFQLRKESFKWEPCRKSIRKFPAKEINESAFDIYYHERKHGKPVDVPKPLPYVFIISLKSPANPDLYNKVRQAYDKILLPIQPKVNIQIFNTQ